METPQEPQTEQAPQSEPTSQASKNPSHHLAAKIGVAVAFLVVFLLGIAFYFNRAYFADLISAASFSAPAEISNIETSLGLTDRAKTMFYATHPSLEGRDSFNEHCDSREETISVLGCYTNSKIYIYNIEEQDLTGVKESTAAHELLHAAWARLDGAEKSRLTTLLTEVYNDDKYHDLLAEDLDVYQDSERIDELHSRVGTEISDLPAELENYYSKYFKNQDLVVDFYDNYITPFRELSEEIDNLTVKLEDLSSEIDEKTKEYYNEAETLSKEIEDFNSCASTAGCFATESAFYDKRSELVAKQTSLDEMYNSLDQKITEYNALVEEYNENIIRGQDLENAINSNAKVEKVN